MNEENVPVETIVREIRHKTRKKYNAEEKMRIVLEGLRGETSIAELCRREGLHPNLYYKWSNEFGEPFGTGAGCLWLGKRWSRDEKTTRIKGCFWFENQFSSF